MKNKYEIKIEDLLKKPSNIPAQPTQALPADAKVDPTNPEAGKVTPEEKEDREDGTVEIPVGGITDTGTIYEQVIRPDGNEPIYKEVNIDNNPLPINKEKEGTETQTPDTINK